ncbi:branched-chain amino acid ABC transporter permease [Paenarthrobacter nicotinovorans]|uniref:branched-chain amino acid ABC transporter permease n=1 Tax=Paenarthrobacter nicotinovorans TaxID=29320 RepID=UPI0037FF1AE2
MLDFLVYFLTVAAIYSLLVLSLNLQTGVTGMINFGQIAYFGIGAYGVGIATKSGGTWWLGLLVGVVVAAGLGAGLGLLGRRLAADYWAIVTLGVAECIRLVAANQTALSGGPQGISGISSPLSGIAAGTRPFAWLATVLIVLALAYAALRVLTRMQFGRSLRLLREQPLLAESLGHPVGRRRVQMLIIAGAIGALGGACYAMYTSFVGPNQLLPAETFVLFTMLIIGGTGSTAGAVAGAVIVQFVYTATRFVNDYVAVPVDQQGSIRVLIVGVILFFFLMLRPSGLLPERPRRIHA